MSYPKHMRLFYLISIAVLTTSCGAEPSPAVHALAVRLIEEGGGSGLPQEYLNGYLDCGVRALSTLPDDKIEAALEAPDGPAIWEILGSKALDDYVKVCRELDIKRGPPALE
jgi:hypothetical protein